jgi:hypothetical protein
MWRGLVIWLLIMAIESLLGTLRILFLAPLVGAETADRIGWPFGLIVVLFITWTFARWIGLTRTNSLLALGAIWAGLTFCSRSELASSAASIGRGSWPRSIPLKAGW